LTKLALDQSAKGSTLDLLTVLRGTFFIRECSMSKDTIFINRRQNLRRTEPDPCTDLSMDLYHRKRRKSTERRDKGRTLVDDYYAYVETSDTDQEQESADIEG
jgi:hypothetical protein